MKPFARRLRRFRDQEDGLVMTEFLIMLPLLIWAFIALFVYWDAFRTVNQAQKAAYSVSDLISRQAQVDTTFINGMQTVTEYLTDNASAVRIRITSVKYKQADNKLYVLFSRSPGNKLPQLTNAKVNEKSFRDRIPVMANQDTVVVVETEVDYGMNGWFARKEHTNRHGEQILIFAFQVGIPPSTFTNFVVTRPRRYLQVCFTGVSCPSTI
jgi:Flp pilus assembly protein TadG